MLDFVGDYKMEGGVLLPGSGPFGAAAMEVAPEKERRRRLAVMDGGCLAPADAEILGTAGVGFIEPIGRADPRIVEYGMGDPVEPLTDFPDGSIQFGKCRMKDGTFLYSFRDPDAAHAEMARYLDEDRKCRGGKKIAAKNLADRFGKVRTQMQEAEGRAEVQAELLAEADALSRRLRDLKRDCEFDEQAYRAASASSGVAAYHTGADTDSGLICSAWSRRRETEDLVDMFGSIVEDGPDGVCDSYMVVGTEFINFLSALMEARVRRHIRGLASEGKVRASRREIDKKMMCVKAVRREDGGWGFDRMYGYVEDLGVVLGVIASDKSV